MERRAITPTAKALLPGRGFDVQSLLAPEQAIVAYFARVTLAPPGIETVSLEEARGRILARDLAADDDYPSVARSAMDGFAVSAASTPGTLRVCGDVAMGHSDVAIDGATALRIPTGGVVPRGADAVVPIEDAATDGAYVRVDEAIESGSNLIQPASDMHRGECVLRAGKRIGAAQLGVLATFGVTSVPVYRRPTFAVLSSGDEIVEPDCKPRPGEVRDSNRYAIAGSLRAMGATVRHYPTLRDEAGEFEAGLRRALEECDAVAVTGGSSVGERDRLPGAVAALGDPGVIVHGLRLRPGKPTLFGAVGTKPILGLPGNPTSALVMLEAVAAPIVAALVGAPIRPAATPARLAEPIRSRAGWTWYVPVAVGHEPGGSLAHPLPLRSFSVSLTARADGYVVVNEGDEFVPEGTQVDVHSFIGSSL